MHGRPAVVPSSVDILTTRPVERVLAIFPPRFDQAGADCGLSQPAAPLQQTEDIHRFLQLTAKRTIDERGAINPSGWRLRNPAACWVSFSTLSLVSARCRDEADITTDFIAVTDSPRSAASVLAVSALLRAGFLPAILSGFLSTFVNRWPIGKRCASCFALEVEKAKLRYSFVNVTAQSWNDQLAPRNPYKRRR